MGLYSALVMRLAEECTIPDKMDSMNGMRLQANQVETHFMFIN